ncbi:MAG: FAD-dependent monooxygenase [Chromatiales bacterium]|nr:MAG: FAD-dependent monooxygenase [Chromatiales bacterium]
MQDTIAIVGAGIGGLTAALALQQSGRRVRVYEQVDRLGEVGAGLTLSPNATRILIGLGLEEPLRAVAIAPDVQIIQHYQTGRGLVQVTRGADTERRYGAPYWQIHRADLHDTLLAAVRSRDPECIRLGHRLTDCDQDGDTVTLHFQDGRSEPAAALIGADGIRSLVRSRLFGDDAPHFTGYAVWRGLVPVQSLSRAAMSVPAGVFIGPGRMLAHYLLRDGRLLNYAASTRRKAWTEEGWNIKAPVDELLADFSDFHAAAREILAATPPDGCFRWGLFSRDPLATWSVDRITLLGDAAHPVLPFIGQGANLAIEDALVLARAVAATPELGSALARYERARAGRCERAMHGSVAAVENYLSTTPEDFDAQQLINEETLGLFDYDAATVPV